jgi:hypothetical protein
MESIYIIERLGKERYAERLARSERLRRWLPEVRKLRAQQKLRQTIREIVAHEGDGHRLLDELPTLVREAQDRIRPKAACRSCSASQ